MNKTTLLLLLCFLCSACTQNQLAATSGFAQGLNQGMITSQGYYTPYQTTTAMESELNYLETQDIRLRQDYMGGYRGYTEDYDVRLKPNYLGGYKGEIENRYDSLGDSYDIRLKPDYLGGYRGEIEHRYDSHRGDIRLRPDYMGGYRGYIEDPHTGKEIPIRIKPRGY